MSDRTKSVSRTLLVGLLALGLSAATVPALAEKGGGKPDGAGDKGGGKHGRPDRTEDMSPASKIKGKSGKAGGLDADAVLATGATAALVAALLDGRTGSLSVGAKPLPPGIRKNLARGKPLPPGIAKQSVPQSVLARLPVIGGHDWVRIGTELVLIGVTTNVIAQVIQDVFD
jgi:hypothetical protein